MKDGGPEFARAAFAPTNVGYEDVGIHDSQEGMSLRDWFAGQALAGGEQLECECYAIADAMLRERLRKTDMTSNVMPTPRPESETR